MDALDRKIAAFCAEYALSPRQSAIFAAMMHGALTNQAIAGETGIRGGLCQHLDRIAQKTMTRSRTELLYLFYEGRRGT